MRRLARIAMVAGTAAAVLGPGQAHAAAHGYDLAGSPRLGWSLAYLGLLLAAGYGAGLPDLARSRRQAAALALAAAGGAATAVSLLQLAVGTPLLPRSVLLASAAVVVPVAMLAFELARDGAARAGRRERVVAVAGPAEAAELAAELAGRAERPAVLVATLSPQAAAGSAPGRLALVEAVRAARATLVVLDRAAQGDDSIVAQAAALHESGVRVRTLSLFYDQWLGKLPLSELERISLLFDIGELHRTRYLRARRLLDVAAAGAGLVALGAVLPVVWAGNRLANRGPVFYRQARVGKGGRRFQILKLRTMRGGGAGAGAWTGKGDLRVTPFGAWLRRTHLDELPQVVNILRGDLSLVGPRPEQPHYVDELAGKIAYYGRRHLVRPGITGWAQVKYPYGASEGDALEKLQYEFYYLRHQSLALDLRIAGRTLRAVLRGGGR